MATPLQIFLSYAREDIDTAKDLYKKLSEAGFKPWMDKADLFGGQRWQQEIPKALRASDFVLIFFSQHSVEKLGYVKREFELALATLEEIPEGTIHTIPIRLDDCTVPEQFSKLHWVDFFEEDGWARLVQALQVGGAQRSRTPRCPVPGKPQPRKFFAR